MDLSSAAEGDERSDEQRARSNRRVMWARLATSLLLASAVVAISGGARANGRFPEAQAIVSVPGDPATLFVRATIGVLVSRDGGERWRWICERALGYGGGWDPPIAATRDGRLWVGLEDGLAATRDGCTLERAAELDGHTVKDLRADARGEVLWAVTGAPGRTSFVWRIAASGERRVERLAALEDTNLMTIEVAPSRPSRVYLSGQPYATIRGRVYRSDDGGRTFTGAESDLEADGPLFIGAVDPRDPDRLLLRHLHAQASDLLLSVDGGRSFRDVLSMKSAMYGFAKSADGATYWAGSGLKEHGLFRSNDRGERFDLVSNTGVLCLYAAAPDALFACQSAFPLGAPALARSRDGGESIARTVRFLDVEGPVGCDHLDAGATRCAGEWRDLQRLLTPTAPRAADASAADASAPDVSAEPPPAEPTRRARCACDVVGAEAAGAGLAWAVAGALALAVWGRPLPRRGSPDPHRAPRRGPRRARMNPARAARRPHDHAMKGDLRPR